MQTVGNVLFSVSGNRGWSGSSSHTRDPCRYGRRDRGPKLISLSIFHETCPSVYLSCRHGWTGSWGSPSVSVVPPRSLDRRILFHFPSETRCLTRDQLSRGPLMGSGLYCRCRKNVLVIVPLRPSYCLSFRWSQERDLLLRLNTLDVVFTVWMKMYW